VTAVLFLLRAVVLVLLWAFVIAAIVAVRHDVFGTRATKQAPRAGGPPARPAPAEKPRQRGRSAARRLVVTDGALAGTTLPLTDNPITIGRADDSTLVLTDDYVSTRHARLVPSGDAWVVEDLGSTNGTYLDKKKVSTPTPVPVGVPIRVGKTVLELRR
jgi:pSer/pThr/pTyr-binding forkhead associated (FHA) protein